MTTSRVLGLVLATTFCWSANSYALTEWTHHRTSNGNHPNGEEQEQMFLMNRARSNPSVEGNWLATSTEPEVAGGRDYDANGALVPVNKTQLVNQFNAIAAKPPAAFDVRLYAAAVAHNTDLINRQAQDHTGQVSRVNAEGFQYTAYRGNVYSYSGNALNAHAAFNIDWALQPAGAPNTQYGMQFPAGHRNALMSIDGNFTNVGIAAKYVGTTYKNDPTPSKRIGEYVVTQNFASANTGFGDHYNVFIVGTVYEDLNQNGRYDDGEGLSGVTVVPSRGAYFAVTASGGGYAVPVTDAGATSVTFSGNGILETRNVTTNSSNSVLVDVVSSSNGTGPRTTGSGAEDLFLMKNVKYTQEFGSAGSNYGTQMIGNSFIAEFENTGEDHHLQIRGYNITDKAQSVVLLNGQPIGTLTGGQPFAHSNRKADISIPAGLQIPDLNTIEIQYTGSSTWGVRALKLGVATAYEPMLSNGVFDTGVYGWAFEGRETHKTLLRSRFVYTGTNGVEFKVKGFNVTAADKVSVLVNGTFVQYLAGTATNGIVNNVMTLPSSLLTSGVNEIELQMNKRVKAKWGVKKLKVTQL